MEEIDYPNTPEQYASRFPYHDEDIQGETFQQPSPLAPGLTPTPETFFGRMRALMDRVKQGVFVTDALIDPGAMYLGGGLVKRPAQVAAILNSTHISNRLALQGLVGMCADVFEEVRWGYGYRIPQDDKPVGFQHVTGDGYGGFLPWEILPQIPVEEPWE